MSDEAASKAPATSEPARATSEPSRCSKLLEEALGRSYVKFIRDKMHELGCDTTRAENFTFNCQPCGSNKVIGFFRADEHGNKGVTICEDNVEQYRISGEHVERTVMHELVHAYDSCRAKVDCNDCRHLACTEIRAALLSGDCDMFNEFRRRNFGFKAQGIACVKRRAELSVAAHPNCAGDKARQAIEEVFEVCYNDTAPFEQKF